MDSAGKVFDPATTGRMFASRSSISEYTVDQTRFTGSVIGGRKTFNMMRNEYPDLNVLMCSGFTRYGVTDELISAGVPVLIANPFRPADLSKRSPG